MSRTAGGWGGWIVWWKITWIEVRITKYELRIWEEWRAAPAGIKMAGLAPMYKNKQGKQRNSYDDKYADSQCCRESDGECILEAVG